MSPDARTPSTSQEPQDVKDAVGVGRRTYTAPRLKLLGSVRDLTLGSPNQRFADLTLGTQMTPIRPM